MTTSTPTRPLDSFESALLAELRSVVAGPEIDPGTATGTATEIPTERPARWRRLLAPALVAAAATVVAVVVVPGLGSSPAYAVTEGNDGEVHVRVDRLEDAAGLERALAAHGIASDITYLPRDTDCAPGRYADAQPQPPGTEMRFSIGGGYRVDLAAGSIRKGETIVISASELSAVPDLDGDGQTTTGGVSASLGIATGPVGPCVPVPAAEGIDP